MKTNIYHVTYTPELKEAELFFWNCNMECTGCLCKRVIWDFLLKENPLANLKDPPRETAKPPERFLDFEEVMRLLDKLKFQQVTMGGMEPTLDPQFPKITRALHDRFGSRNVVFTNLYEMPSFEDTDIVVFGLMAVTDSLHREYTGVSNKGILENFLKVYQSGKKLGVASLFIPDYIGIQEIERIAKYIASVDKDISLFLRPYLKAGDNPWRPPTHDEIDEALGIAKRHLNKVNCLYGDEELKYEVLTIFPDSAALKEIVGHGPD